MKQILVFLLLFSFHYSNAYPLPILAKDHQGYEVTFLQKMLSRTGHITPLTGYFDEKTEKAVKDFQQKQKLEVSGTVNDSTWTLLLNHKSLKYQPRGVDISHYENEVFKNGEIPFDDFNQCNFDYCYSKATHGADRKDEWFEYNWAKCQEKHILRGNYHFFSLLKDDIDAQINNFLSLNIDYNQLGILPPCLDIEEDARPFDTQNIILNRELVIARMHIWLQAVESATGRKPMIYTRKSFWEDVLGNPTGFEDYLLWVAYYREDTPPKTPAAWNGKWHFWQHTDKGNVGGLKRKFDLNRFNGSMEDLLKLANF